MQKRSIMKMGCVGAPAGSLMDCGGSPFPDIIRSSLKLGMALVFGVAMVVIYRKRKDKKIALIAIGLSLAVIAILYWILKAMIPDPAI